MRLIVGHVRGSSAQLKSDGTCVVKDVHNKKPCDVREIILEDWSHALLMITEQDGSITLFELTPHQKSSLYYRGAFGIMGGHRRDEVKGSAETLKAIFDKSPFDSVA